MNASQGKSAILAAREGEFSASGVEMPARSRPRRRRFWIGVCLVVLAAAGIGLYQARFAPTVDAPVSAALVESAPVIRLHFSEVMTLSPMDLRDTVRVSGSLAPARQATLAARVGGTVERVAVQTGDRVQAGDVIAEVDTDALQSQRAQQASSIAATRAQLRLAQSQLESTASLVERGASPRSALESAQSNVDGLQANLDAQSAQLAQLDVDLANATIRAPFSGVISAREVDPGQTLNAGTPVGTLVDLAQMEVRATVSLSQAADVAVGQTVELMVDGIEDRTFEAVVRRISPVASEGTRSLPIFLQLDNSDETLLGGMFVTGRIIVSQDPQSLAVPSAAVRDAQTDPYLLVVEDDRLERRDITIARQWNGGRLAQVSDGLSAGEMIVSAPLTELAPGMAVALEGEL